MTGECLLQTRPFYSSGMVYLYHLALGDVLQMSHCIVSCNGVYATSCVNVHSLLFFYLPLNTSTLLKSGLMMLNINSSINSLHTFYRKFPLELWYGDGDSSAFQAYLHCDNVTQNLC